MSTEKVLWAIDRERQRQDRKWGGKKHDDQHETKEFIQWIQDYASWARMMDSMKNHGKTRNRLVQVAALAVAAIESMDRKIHSSN